MARVSRKFIVAVVLTAWVSGVSLAARQPYNPQLQQAINQITNGIITFVTLGMNAGSYINWGTGRQASGYGFRDNVGVMEVKNSGGSWSPFVFHGGTFTMAASTCPSPALRVTGALTTGIAMATTPTVSLCVGGTTILTASATAVATTTAVVLPAYASGSTTGVYAGTQTLARLFQPALAAGGQAQGENAFGPGGGNSTMTNGAGAAALASANTAMGWDSLIAATTSEQQTAYGHRALKASTTGKYNVAVGGGALLNLTGNLGNVAVGTSALLTITSGDYNTALGHDALEFLQSGTLNTAVGKRANWQATSGDNNTVVGGDAMFSNLTGAANTAIGQNALFANLASNNTALGANALAANTTGATNVAIGRAALLNNTTTSFNTALGDAAGRFQADGTTPLVGAQASVYLGFGARGFNNSDNNTIVIGANAAGAGANTAVIGNASVTSVYLGSSTPAATLNAARVLVGDGLVGTPGLGLLSDPTTGLYRIAAGFMGASASGAGIFGWANSVSTGIQVTSGIPISWASGVLNSASDLFLSRESAAVLQFGVDAAGVTNQMIKGPDRITSDGVGGDLTIAGGRNRGASAGGSLIFQTSPAAGAGVTGTLTTQLSISGAGLLATGPSTIFQLGSGATLALAQNAIFRTAPTISSGFGTSPTVPANNGTIAFTINVGTGGVATSGVIGLPTAANGWRVQCGDITTQTATVFITKQTATTTTTATVGNYDAAGIAAAWASGDVLSCSAVAY